MSGMAKPVHGNIRIRHNARDQPAVELGLHAPCHDLPPNLLQVGLTVRFDARLLKHLTVADILEASPVAQVLGCRGLSRTDSARNADYKPLTRRPLRWAAHE